MTKPKQIAEWMIGKLQTSEDGLFQVDVVSAIEEVFGAEFVYVSDLGAKSIDKRVLNHFRKLTGNEVVWVTQHGGGFWSGAHWRKRESGDAPGRTQYAE